MSRREIQAPRGASRAAPPRSPPLWLLVMITASGTMGMHIFIPALPEAAAELGVAAGTAQLTITLYMVGLGLGQLFYGPLSDRIGRRPALFAGLGLYAAGGAMAALAPGIGVLLAARLLQAFGGCAGLALGRAIVRDTAEPQAAAARLALLNLVLSASPGLAPVAGGWLAIAFGWRAIFVALALLAVLTIALAVVRLPETRQAGSGGNDVAALLRSYGRLMRLPVFLGYVIGGGCATTSLYAFMAASPFIFVHMLGRPSQEVGYYYFILILGMTLGSLLANRLLGKVEMGRLLQGASLGGTLAAAAFLVVVLTGHLSVVATVAPMFVFVTAVGTAAPLSVTKAVSVDPKMIGAAAGLYGCGQMIVGAVCTAAAGLGSNPALSSGLVLVAASVVGQVSLAVALRRERPA